MLGFLKSTPEMSVYGPSARSGVKAAEQVVPSYKKSDSAVSRVNPKAYSNHSPNLWVDQINNNQQPLFLFFLRTWLLPFDWVQWKVISWSRRPTSSSPCFECIAIPVDIQSGVHSQRLHIQSDSRKLLPTTYTYYISLRCIRCDEKPLDSLSASLLTFDLFYWLSFVAKQHLSKWGVSK